MQAHSEKMKKAFLVKQAQERRNNLAAILTGLAKIQPTANDVKLPKTFNEYKFKEWQLEWDFINENTLNPKKIKLYPFQVELKKLVGHQDEVYGVLCEKLSKLMVQFEVFLSEFSAPTSDHANHSAYQKLCGLYLHDIIPVADQLIAYIETQIQVQNSNETTISSDVVEKNSTSAKIRFFASAASSDSSETESDDAAVANFLEELYAQEQDRRDADFAIAMKMSESDEFISADEDLALAMQLEADSAFAKQLEAGYDQNVDHNSDYDYEMALALSYK